MEYLIGSFLTLVMIILVLFFINKKREEHIPLVRYSQSHVHELVHGLLPSNHDMKKIDITQASKHFDKTHIKIIVVQNKAYWIKDSVLYTAAIIDGDIDHENAQGVDIMSMDKVQLDKMIFIVDKLTEGTTNDYWNAGK